MSTSSSCHKNKYLLGSISASCCVVVAAGLFLYHNFIKLPKGPNRMSWSKNVFGHRGCRNIPGLVENTVPALDYCRQSPGTDGVEIDVRCCKDALVTFHDARCAPLLEKGENSKESDAEFLNRQLVDTTLAELREMPFRDDLGSSRSSSSSSSSSPSEQENLAVKKTQRINTAEECVRFCKEHKLKLLLEVKTTPGSPDLERVLALFENKDLAEFLYEYCTVISFNFCFLYKLRAANLKIATCQLARKQTVHRSIDTGSEVRFPLALRILPVSITDTLLWLLQNAAPFWNGASMFGPEWVYCNSDKDLSYWVSQNKIPVYWWTFNPNKPEMYSQRLRAWSGVCLATDSKYSQFS